MPEPNLVVVANPLYDFRVVVSSSTTIAITHKAETKMSAGVYDIEVDQGAAWSTLFQLKHQNGLPFSLVGYTAKAHVRRHPETNDFEAAFSIIFDPDRSTGRLVLSLSAEQTGLFEFYQAHYDLLLTSSSGTVIKPLRGFVRTIPLITKDPAAV